MPHAGEFTAASCQATIFTPEADVSAARFMSRLMPAWAERFDGDPIMLPLPEGIPREVPKVVLQAQRQDWRCEIASSQLNLFWRRPSPDYPAIGLREFYDLALPLLDAYRAFVDSPVRRVAAVVNRYAFHETPALYLARHFCLERWREAPFNRPENFELHAHKTFRLDNAFMVNSWVRNKTGKVKEIERPIVIIEQDLNTLAEETTHEYSAAEFHHFFRAAAVEFDTILSLYYPADCE